MVLDLHQLSTDLKVELVISEFNADNMMTELVDNYAFTLESSEGSRRTYKLRKMINNPGTRKIAIRISPTHQLMAHPMDFAYVRWVSAF